MAFNASSIPGFPNLTQKQQELLRSALLSNERNLNMSAFRSAEEANIFSDSLKRTPSLTQGIDPHVFDQPYSDVSSSKSPSSDSWRGPPTFGNSFLPDFSNGQATNFAVDLPQDVLDSLSGTTNNGEKRKNVDDGSDDDSDEQDPKRRDGDDKGPKKPGRKPLMAEPTTVSKSASNLTSPINAHKGPNRNARLKIALLKGLSASARSSTSKISRPRLQICKRSHRQRTRKIACCEHRS